MPTTVACIAGQEICRQCDAGAIAGEKIGPRETPFGTSAEIFCVQMEGESFYLLPRYGVGTGKPAPRKVNYRANLYALKDLGTRCVLAWGPGGAINRTFAIGDMVILSDVIDRTYLRPKTFFENSPLGFLRQFPVFCPTLRKAAGEVLHEMKLVYHGAGTAAVNEGPRLETPAEVRMLTDMGVEVVTHAFVPELFLARELSLCYAAICYIVNYAETGSRHRPFGTGDLFGGLARESEGERLAGVLGALARIVRNVAAIVRDAERICDCDKTMSAHVREYGLAKDWRKWFE